jgi:hypothetical protein
MPIGSWPMVLFEVPDSPAGVQADLMWLTGAV